MKNGRFISPSDVEKEKTVPDSSSLSKNDGSKNDGMLESEQLLELVEKIAEQEKSCDNSTVFVFPDAVSSDDSSFVPFDSKNITEKKSSFPTEFVSNFSPEISQTKGTVQQNIDAEKNNTNGYFLNKSKNTNEYLEAVFPDDLKEEFCLEFQEDWNEMFSSDIFGSLTENPLIREMKSTGSFEQTANADTENQDKQTRNIKKEAEVLAVQKFDTPNAGTLNVQNVFDADSAVLNIDWGKAYEENKIWLRTVIAARVGEPAAVDEVLQEVSLAAVRQKAPIHDIKKVAPWLYRLAVLQSLLYRRTMGRKRKLIDRYTQKTDITEHDQKQLEPLEWLLMEERRQTVHQALKTLPVPQQELLLLKYIHDWSYKEMAEKLGISVSAVQAKLHRARQMLRHSLSPYMEES